jgi:hypothetical protein
MDLLTLYLDLCKTRNGRGVSGTPVIPLIFYLIAGMGIKFPGVNGFIVLGIMLTFHISCQYLIPKAYEALVK